MNNMVIDRLLDGHEKPVGANRSLATKQTSRIVGDQEAPGAISAPDRRSLKVAYALLLLGGWMGLHRFYTGRFNTGLTVMFAVLASVYVALISYAMPDVFGFTLFDVQGYIAALGVACVIAAPVYLIDAITLPSAVAAYNSDFENQARVEAEPLVVAPAKSPAGPSWLQRARGNLNGFGQARSEGEAIGVDAPGSPAHE